MTTEDTANLISLITKHRRLTVLSGAGCSTGSGIPDYRDDDGEWKHARPVQFQDFVRSQEVRQRYWARSFVGWPRIATARPNAAHRALAFLESRGFVHQLITQNVDELHRKAGSEKVVDLHGVLSRVRCLGCGNITDRHALQRDFEAMNPNWSAKASRIKPDGDAQVSDAAAREFSIPSCECCGGILKPDVVFFGENVPRQRVKDCASEIKRSDALLVVGSSLMVYSGFRFARLAHQANIPIIIVNRGKTRADDLANRRFSNDCAGLLADAAAALAA